MDEAVGSGNSSNRNSLLYNVDRYDVPSDASRPLGILR